MNSVNDKDHAWVAFWTEKLGFYPTKMVKTGRVTNWKEDNREKDEIEIEFTHFLKKQGKNDNTV